MDPIRIRIPTLVRIKPGALGRLGIYLRRESFLQVAMVLSDGLPPKLLQIVTSGLREEGVRVKHETRLAGHTIDLANGLADALPGELDAVVAVGGGKAMDVAKQVATKLACPCVVAPTSLSNDGFCSPQSSLLEKHRRITVQVDLPHGVVVDTEVCLQAPGSLTAAGVGDLMCKLTAVADWKLAFHTKGTPVNDLAALLSDATVLQFMARPVLDLDGLRTLATALLLNGVAMEIAGSSRPASGGEHLWSHALDRIARQPRLHGLQTGMAAYVTSRFMGLHTEKIGHVFDAMDFWQWIREQPFQMDEWVEALRLAPQLKDNYYTILSQRDWTMEARRIFQTDPRLEGCFQT